MFPGSGEMTERIRFERRCEVPDDGTGNVEADTWTPFATVWAKVLPLPVSALAAERVLAGRLTGTALYTIVVGYSGMTKDITAADRAVDIRSGTVYNVRSAVDIDGRKAFLTLDVERGVAV